MIFLAAVLVSALPTLAMFLASRHLNKQSLNLMMAFAAGALLSDALDHAVSKSAMTLSISAFLLIDLVISGNSDITSILGDAIHNFTDGMALVSAFQSGHGWRTTIAIILHEIPHQFADLSILMRSGYSMNEIFKWQLITAIGCFLGVLFAGRSIDPITLNSITSASFLYLSMSSILPAIRECKESPVMLYMMFVIGIYSMP